MSGDNLYLLSALPPLGELSSVPPMSLAELLERVIDSGGNRVLLEVLLLSDDLLQRQAVLAGEIEIADPAVLTPAQIGDEESLPEYLVSSESSAATLSVLDIVWESYYSYAASVAVEHKSEFLNQWIKYEVGLRNALVIARAKTLDIDPQEYVVTPWIGGAKEDFTEVISEWTSASDPFAGLRALDEARWNWLKENDGWFTFADDEVAAYGAKLMLLHRWHRLGKEAPPPAEKAVVQ